MKKKFLFWVNDSKGLDDLDYVREAIQEDESQIIEAFYKKHRGTFVGFLISRYAISESEAVDIYQDSFAALYKNIKTGKLSTLHCSLKTYLFQIGKNLTCKMFRDRKEVYQESLDHLSLDIGIDLESEEWKQMQHEVYYTVLEMKEPCNQILSLFFDDVSMKEIASAMGYPGSDAAKTQKYLCYRKLKKIMIKKLNLN